MKVSKSLKDISEYLKQIEYITEKVNFIKKEIPDIKVKLYTNCISFYPRFVAESVNQNYTGLDFHKRYDTLSVSPYQTVDFSFNNKIEKVKIHSNPGTSRLVYITRRYDNKSGIMLYQLNFSKMTINFERNQFNNSMLNNCRLEILSFMNKHSNITVNTKHLDPKLKNLMAFT